MSGVNFEAGNLKGHVEVSGIHFNAQIQAFSIGASSSSQYHRTISIGENRDLNGNHTTQQATNVFHANRHDFAFPPRTSESPRYIALSLIRERGRYTPDEIAFAAVRGRIRMTYSTVYFRSFACTRSFA